MSAGPPGAGPAPLDDSKERINPNEKFQPPSRDSALLNAVLWGAFVLLGAAAVVLALQLLGVIDLIDDETEEEQAPAVVEEIAADDELEEMPEEEAEDSEARTRREVNRLIESARSDMESNRLASALDRLDRARQIDPERADLYEMKAEVHEELGETDEAESLREQAEELLRLAEEREAEDELPTDEEQDGDDGEDEEGE